MTTSAPLDLSALKAASGGTVVGPADDGWDAARQAWNLAADQQPEAVAFAETAADIAAVVKFAGERGLAVAPQGTGHAAPALGALDGVILLKTMRMGGVEVDASARTARVEAGALWGDLGVAAGAHGLTGLAGSSPDVGIVGYSLGGGIGWLSRRHGLASESVRAIEVVTAAGEHVRADADSEPDLFWALRGGGGSFGVVTALELDLFPAASVYAGTIKWPAARAAEVFAAYTELVAAAPDELTTAIRFLCLPPIPEVPAPLRGVPLIDITGAYLGDEEGGRELLAPLRALGDPVMDTFAVTGPEALCHINGDPEQPTPGITHQTLLRDLTPSAVDALIEHAGHESGSPLLAVSVRHLGGALAEAPADAGALGRIDAGYALYGVGVPMAPGAAEAINAHHDIVIGAVADAGAGDYLNFADRVSDASGAFDADTYARLRRIRAATDPDRLLRPSHPVL